MLWCKTTHLIFSCLLLIGAAGCGFRPQYGNLQAQAKAHFEQVYVSPIADRDGQLLRNQILEFIGEPKTHRARYKLTVQLGVNHREVGFEKNLNTTRFEVDVTANYLIEDVQAPTKPLRGACRSSEYYSTSKVQIFQNIAAAENAPKRGLEIVGRCLIDRLTTVLRQAEEVEHK